MVAGAGFFTDAYVHRTYTSQISDTDALHARYDIFAINIASVMLDYVYGKGAFYLIKSKPRILLNERSQVKS